MVLVRVLAKQRFNLVDLVTISAASGSLLTAGWGFSWFVLTGGLLVSLTLEHITAKEQSND